MAHFAELDENNIVLRVVVVDNEHEAIGAEWCANLLGGRWLQTSFNGTIRKNFAGVGFQYDATRDAFIPPQPAESRIFDKELCRWFDPSVD